MAHIIDQHLYQVVMERSIIKSATMFDNKIDKGVSIALGRMGISFDDYYQKRRFYAARLEVRITRVSPFTLYNVILDNRILLYQFNPSIL